MNIYAFSSLLASYACFLFCTGFIDLKNTDTLGLRLVTILVEDQLNGEIRLTRDNGTEFSIMFK